MDINNFFDTAATDLAAGTDIEKEKLSDNFKGAKNNFIDMNELTRQVKSDGVLFHDVNRELVNTPRNQKTISLNEEVVSKHIRNVEYFTGAKLWESIGYKSDLIPQAVQNLTICHVVTTEGILFTGESVCLNTQDYSIRVGREAAFNAARSKLIDYLAMKYRAERFQSLKKNIY